MRSFFIERKLRPTVSTIQQIWSQLVKFVMVRHWESTLKVNWSWFQCKSIILYKLYCDVITKHLFQLQVVMLACCSFGAVSYTKRPTSVNQPIHTQVSFNEYKWKIIVSLSSSLRVLLNSLTWNVIWDCENACYSLEWIWFLGSDVKRCKGCRFKACLHAGMEPHYVHK